MQFEAILKVEYAKVVFSLKTIVQNRKELSKVSFVIFVNLVKVCNNIKLNIIYITLKNIGTPDKFISQVGKLYRDFKVILKVKCEVVI